MLRRIIVLIVIYLVLGGRLYGIAAIDELKLIDYVIDNHEGLAVIFLSEFPVYTQEDLSELHSKTELLMTKNLSSSVKANLAFFHSIISYRLGEVTFDQTIKELRRIQNDFANEICFFTSAKMNGMFGVNHPFFVFFSTALKIAKDVNWDKNKIHLILQKESEYYKKSMEYFQYSLKNPLKFSETIPYYTRILNNETVNKPDLNILKAELDDCRLEFETRFSLKKQEIKTHYSLNPFLLEYRDDIFIWLYMYYLSELQHYNVIIYINSLKHFCHKYSEDGFLFFFNHLYYVALCKERKTVEILDNTSMLESSIKAEKRYLQLLSHITDSRYSSTHLLNELFTKYCNEFNNIGIDVSSFLLNESLDIQTSRTASTNHLNKRERRTINENLEKRLKSMPKEEAQRQCLKKALELSEMPDKNSEELLFYLRGLPMVEEDGTTRVLHRISSTAKDRKLLESAMQLQGKWLSLCSEPRKGVLDDLSGMLESDDSKLRRQAIASLGRSGSLDALSILLREIETRPDDQEVISSIGRILGWSQSDASLDEECLLELKKNASVFLQALDALRKGNNFVDGKAK